MVTNVVTVWNYILAVVAILILTNESKTLGLGHISLSSRQRLQTQNGREIYLFVEAKQINGVKNTKSLGLNFDEHLS